MSSDNLLQHTFPSIICLVFAFAGIFYPVTAEETAAPPPGKSHWIEPFRRVDAYDAYVSTIVRDGRIEYWHSLWQHEPGNTLRYPLSNKLVVRYGKSMDALGPREVVADLKPMIRDVPVPNQPEKMSETRGVTRGFMAWYPDIGYVFLGCVVHQYAPGAVPLLPALWTSRTGRKDTWRYLGKMKGEIEEEAAKRIIWSDGGSIFRLEDGRWRVYLDGFNGDLAIAEAPGLKGPWKFIHDAGGKIRALARVYSTHPKVTGQGLTFPTVLRVARNEWHLWSSDNWPVRAVYHLYSTDGIHWKLYGKQPEINPAMTGGKPIKALRVFVEPGGQHIIGMLSVRDKRPDGDEGWVIHTSRMRTGPPPIENKSQ